MRILAIRGAGLASLAAPFEIDLTAEPLGGTGLFAITGHTGAGKSTILDALCLALYGDYPRIAAARQEHVLDVSGQRITVSNPVNIVSRGVSEARAEVEFVGQDGVACRVGWQVRRARGRVEGRAQDEQRRIDLLDGSASIATGKTDVLREVVARTGLTFEQFRRTALLAQGEFDTFLLADERQRAELLEKITGTQIYAAISRRVYEETRARSQAIAALDAKSAAVEVLDEAARQGLVETRAVAGQRLAVLAVGAEAAARRVALAEWRIEAVSRVAEAETAAREAGEKYGAASLDRARLAAFDRVAPLRALFEALRRAEGEVARLDQELTVRQARKSAAATQLLDVETRRVEADRAAADAEAMVLRSTPEWAAAERADHALATAAAEAQAAQSSVEIAARQCEEAVARTDDLELQHGSLAKALDAWRSHPAATPARTRLSAGIERVGELIERRRALLATIAGEEAVNSASASEAASLEARFGDNECRMAATSTRLAELKTRLAGQREALVALDESGIDRRDGELSTIDGGLRGASEAALDCARHAAARANAGEALRQASSEARSARDDLAAADAQWSRLERALREIADLADIAEVTASQQAEALRRALVKGAPCPVCGAAEHPFADQGHGAVALIEEVRARRNRLREESTLASNAAVSAKGRLAAVEATAQAAERAAIEAGAAEAEAITAFQSNLTELRRSAAAMAWIDGLPATPNKATAADLTAKLTRLRTARTALAGVRQQAGRLRAAMDDHARQQASIEDELAVLAGEQNELRRQLHAARDSAGRAQARLDASQPVLVALDRELGPLLADGGMALADVNRDGAVASAKLRRLVDEHRDAVMAIDRLGQELATVATAWATARAAAAAAQSSRDVAKAAADTRHATLAKHQQERAGMLGGAPTGAHRDRILAERVMAMETREMLRAETALLAVAAERSTVEHEAVASSARLAAIAIDEVAAELATGCQQLGIAREEARRLLDVDPAEVAALRDRLAVIDANRADAARALATRQADLAGRTADGAEGIDLDAARTAQAAIGRDIEGVREEVLRATVALETDDDARARAGTLAGEIAAAKDEALVWEEVDAAIGSANGDAFRRFAQGITLQQLVRLANVELGALAARYTLARSPIGDLALHIVDRDLGGEARALRGLSGGERFLVSLALALALSRLEGGQSFVDTLFIDEGFGSLDAETLDIAIDALEQLQGAGRKVGVITHVAAMIERIAVQVCVERRGGGRSVVRIGAR